MSALRQGLFASVVLAGIFATSTFAAISTPHVAGNHQTPAEWQPGTDPMTETSPGSGVFQRAYSGLTPNTRYEFKITDGTWTNSYPGPNSWFVSDAAGNMALTYDTNTYADGWLSATERLGVSSAPVTWTAAGNFQSEVGGTDWTNNDAMTAMVPQGGGVYSFDAHTGPGSFEWKAVVTGSWDSISQDTRSVSTANFPFTVGTNEFARLSVDALTGTARVDVIAIPEPATVALLGLGALGVLGRRRRGA
ncbi:MAG TPA: PEP-CTERM sorting domain-containing protein [Tepidisphaeraceae bacterium]|nr:PEP-CTERM sorting domain-containing protein [Tepidisphaeraceae bacterium]